MKLKQIKHPKAFFMQLSDISEDGENMGVAFMDESEQLDPNVFDDETLQRAQRLLGCAYMLIEHRREGTPIPMLNEGEDGE